MQGEAAPVRKDVDDEVVGGSMSTDGALMIRVRPCKTFCHKVLVLAVRGHVLVPCGRYALDGNIVGHQRGDCKEDTQSLNYGCGESFSERVTVY